jgi:hypothetical protein
MDRNKQDEDFPTRTVEGLCRVRILEYREDLRLK